MTPGRGDGNPEADLRLLTGRVAGSLFARPEPRATFADLVRGLRGRWTRRTPASWLTGETERLLRELVGAPDQGIRADVAQHPERWGELCGWYRPRAQRTDIPAWSMLGGGARVGVRRGHLRVRTLSPIPALYRGRRLHPDDLSDPEVFRMASPGTAWVRPERCSAGTPRER